MVSYLSLLAITPTAMYSVNNLFNKKSSKEIGGAMTAIMMTAAGIVPLAIAALFYPFSITIYQIILSLVGGTFLGFGRVLFFKPMETQQISNTSVFLLVQNFLLVIYGIYGLGESITTLEIFAGIMMAIGVLLVSTTNNFRLNKAMLPALLGNLVFVGYWVFLGYAIDIGSANTPALLAIGWISATITTIVAFKLILHTKKAAPKKAKKMKSASAMIAGLINGSGNIIQGALVYLNAFALGSIFSALNPVFTSIMAYFVFKERLNKMQLAGLMIATVGAVLIVVYR